MLMLGNQTIPVKIPSYLNKGEYLEALEVFKLPKRLTHYTAKLPDSYINSKVLIRVKCTFRIEDIYYIAGDTYAGLVIGNMSCYPVRNGEIYGAEHERFLIDTLYTNEVKAYSVYTIADNPTRTDFWYVEADIYRIV